MASTAAAYPNSGDYGSEKASAKFTRIAQIRASSLAERHRNLIVAMMHKNQFGDELWMSTESISVVMGRVCYRRKAAETDTKGRRLHDCERISRRAVQRLIDEVVSLGVLTQIYRDNVQVPYGGGKKFRHTATYRLNPDKLAPRMTHEQYVEERDRGRAKNRQAHREETEREHAAGVTPIRKPAAPADKPLPPAPAAPLPARGKPAAAEAPKRFTTLTRREVPKFVGAFVRLMKPKPVESVPEPEPPRDELLDSHWKGILGLIEKRIERHTFDTWLKPTRASESREGVLYVRVPTVEFVHIGTKFATQFTFALRELKLPYQALQFFAPEAKQPKSAPSMNKQDALLWACREFGISPKHGVEVLKLHGHTIDRPDSGEERGAE